jgi:hypothetical protein
MDILSQTKLSRSEWESIEKPVSDSEKQILHMINDGYSNVNIISNLSNSMITFTKLPISNEIHIYLFEKYFQPITSNIIETVITNKMSSYPTLLEKWRTYKSKITCKKKQKKIKSGDSIRIEQVDKKINTEKQNIYEFECMDLCKTVLKNALKNVPYDDVLCTLMEWRKATIYEVNPYVIAQIDLVITFGKCTVKNEMIIKNAYKNIEKNSKLYKYEDKKLFSHQKELFTMCRPRIENETTIYSPKLILYTAPTGTGKTLSPIGLSNDYKIIFVCVARHIGLALAKSAISMNKRVAFAFGCDTISDIRLHYFSAVDYEKNWKSGGIYKVDHSKGENVEIMICDVHSYLFAMRYMLSFNNCSHILMYWDEPTMTLDYRDHPLHDTIQKNWKENEIPNIVLSCATLPKEEEIHSCIQDFYIRYDNNVRVHTITSYDCRKSIPILKSDGYSFMPHLHYNLADDFRNYAEFCENNKTLLRYFDLQEIVRFIMYIHDNNMVADRYNMNTWFEDISEITMNNIKLYYLVLMKKIDVASPEWDTAKTYLSLQQQKRYASDMVKHGGHLQRVQSVQDSIKLSTKSTIIRNNSESQVDEKRKQQSNEALMGVFLTTKDAHTLTDGPTIYIADNIINLAKFYVQQSKIPEVILKQLTEGIQKNDKLFNAIQNLEEELEKRLQVKDNTDAENCDKKKKSTTIREKSGNDEGTQTIKENIQLLRKQLFHVSLNSNYIPNTTDHQEKWTPDKKVRKNAFRSDISEKHVKDIMEMYIPVAYKVLILMGVGVLIRQEVKEYEELVKQLADEQKLFLILTSSDYIYGTNYQFCHGFVGKDLQNMTPQKTLQTMGRIGRNKHQQDYTIRFRDNSMIHSLFQKQTINVEADNMNRLFRSF